MRGLLNFTLLGLAENWNQVTRKKAGIYREVSMRFTIIGGGRTGQAAAAYLTSKGAECLIKTRDAGKAAIFNQHGITAEGGINGNFKVRATTDMQEAADFSDMILVMTVANAHKEVAGQLGPCLKQDQKILIFNSNWGALEFKQVLGDSRKLRNLIVAETGAQLFVASSEETGRVNMSVKAKITVSAVEPEDTQPLLDCIKEYFPQFEKGSSIIETTMSTTNPVIHVPITLLNAARIENAQPFLFYGDGASKEAVQLIENVDRERIAVAKALGCEIDDVLTGINRFWEKKHDNLFDALTKNSTYLHAKGPGTLEHRYITEDVPYGIAPIAKIGRLFGIETPYTDALLGILGCIFGTDVVNGGIEFRREDFEG